MKKFTFILAIVVMCVLMAGCTSINFAPFTSSQGVYVSSDVPVTKIGSATSRVYLWIFGGEMFPTVEKVASDNKISRIATVQHVAKPGILLLWIDYTTIVSGN
jgi:hypothetical protein